jgi:hypothetical protein
MRALILLGFACAVALPQGEKKLTPRELFYSPPAASKPAVPIVKKAKPVRPAANTPAEPAQPTEPAVAASVAPPPAAGGVQFVSVSNRPLGLRYSLLKRAGAGQEEVDPDTEFHAGDRIRLAVEANDSGYLYLINRGSSGAWNVLFPSPEVAGGDNRIQAGIRYEIPAGYTFTFDERAGEEKLFIVFSRQPEGDLERLIYSLGEAKAPAPSEPKTPKVLLASANINDSIVGKLRNAYARDLVIEKVSEATPGPRREKAVYAVNPSTNANARVVADLTLIHR